MTDLVADGAVVGAGFGERAIAPAMNRSSIFGCSFGGVSRGGDEHRFGAKVFASF